MALDAFVAITGVEERGTLIDMVVVGTVIFAAVLGVKEAKRRGHSTGGVVAAGIGAGFAASVVTGVLLAVFDAADGEANVRADLIDEVIDRGGTAEQGACIADRLERHFGELPTDLSRLREEDSVQILRAALQCQGDFVDATDRSECLIEALANRIEVDELTPDELVDAVASFDAADRRYITEASLQCAGMSSASARCVTDAMTRQLGRNIFDTEGLELSSEQQSVVEELIASCADSDINEQPDEMSRQDRDETATAPGLCAELTAAVMSAVETGERADGTAAVDGLTRVVERLRASVSTAPPEVRPLIEQAAQMYDTFVDRGRVAINRAADTHIAELIDLTDEMVLLSHTTFLHPIALYGIGDPDSVCADSFDRPNLDLEDNDAVGNPASRLPTISARLEELGHPEIAQDYLPPGILDLIDRDITKSLSGMQDAYRECLGDIDAMKVGDNDGCDALHAACDQRDLPACNDLYWASTVGSDYERFAASCGGRTTFGNPGYAGFCEDLD